MTIIPTKARIAGTIALALTLASFALPADAKTFTDVPLTYDDEQHDECYSKSEVKYVFKAEGLRHVKVSPTHEDDIYKVSGWYKHSTEKEELAPAALAAEQNFSGDYKLIHYVVLYDACNHTIVKYLEPKGEKGST